jgi:hypothetical protein
MQYCYWSFSLLFAKEDSYTIANKIIIFIVCISLQSVGYISFKGRTGWIHGLGAQSKLVTTRHLGSALSLTRSSWLGRRELGLHGKAGSLGEARKVFHT